MMMINSVDSGLKIIFTYYRSKMKKLTSSANNIELRMHRMQG